MFQHIHISWVSGVEFPLHMMTHTIAGLFLIYRKLFHDFNVQEDDHSMPSLFGMQMVLAFSSPFPKLAFEKIFVLMVSELHQAKCL